MSVLVDGFICCRCSFDELAVLHVDRCASGPWRLTTSTPLSLKSEVKKSMPSGSPGAVARTSGAAPSSRAATFSSTCCCCWAVVVASTAGMPVSLQGRKHPRTALALASSCGRVVAGKCAILAASRVLFSAVKKVVDKLGVQAERAPREGVVLRWRRLY